MGRDELQRTVRNGARQITPHFSEKTTTTMTMTTMTTTTSPSLKLHFLGNNGGASHNESREANGEPVLVLTILLRQEISHSGAEQPRLGT